MDKHVSYINTGLLHFVRNDEKDTQVYISTNSFGRGAIPRPFVCKTLLVGKMRL